MSLQLWAKHLHIPESDVLNHLAQINDFYPYYLIKMIKKEYLHKITNSSSTNKQEVIIKSIETLLNDSISKGKSKLFNLKDLTTLGINLARLNI